MNDFFSRCKYKLLTIFIIFVTLFILFCFAVPKASFVAKSLATVRLQLKISESIQGNVASTDSLIQEYRKLSERIDKHTNNQVTSSKILTFVHGTAEKSKVLLQDLSTEEIQNFEEKTEIPVSFKAIAEFSDFHRFITELENGDFCVEIGSIDMGREENGNISASVKLSVVSRRNNNE